MKNCTQCHKPSSHTRSDYRRRGKNHEWITIIRPDEKLCPKCAEKRGARTLTQIHNDR